MFNLTNLLRRKNVIIPSVTILSIVGFLFSSNVTFSSVSGTNLPTGTYISYVGGNRTAFNTISGITRMEAATNCRIDKNKNPGKSIRCTWPNKIIVKNSSTSSQAGAANSSSQGTSTNAMSKLNLSINKSNAKVGESVTFNFDIGSDYKTCSLHISVGNTAWGTFGLDNSNKIYDYYNGPKNPIGSKTFMIDKSYLRSDGRVVLLADCYNSATQKNDRKELVLSTNTSTTTGTNNGSNNTTTGSTITPIPTDYTLGIGACALTNIDKINLVNGGYQGGIGSSSQTLGIGNTYNKCLQYCDTSYKLNFSGIGKMYCHYEGKLAKDHSTNQTYNLQPTIGSSTNTSQTGATPTGNTGTTPTTTTTTTTTTPTCVDLQYEFQCTQAMNGKYKQLKFANGNTENITAISDCTSTTFSYMTSSSATSWNGHIGAGWKACTSAPVTTTVTTQNPVTTPATNVSINTSNFSRVVQYGTCGTYKTLPMQIALYTRGNWGSNSIGYDGRNKDCSSYCGATSLANELCSTKIIQSTEDAAKQVSKDVLFAEVTKQQVKVGGESITFYGNFPAGNQCRMDFSSASSGGSQGVGGQVSEQLFVKNGSYVKITCKGVVFKEFKFTEEGSTGTTGTTTGAATQNPVATASVATRLYGVPYGANIGYSITRGTKIHGEYVFSSNASNVSCQVWYSKNAASSLGDFITFAIENGQSNTSSKISDSFDIDTASINADAPSFIIQSKCGGFVNGVYTNVQDRQVVTLITRKPVVEYFRLVQSTDETVIEWSATDTSAELCTLKKSGPTGAVQFQVAYPAKNTYRELKTSSAGATYQLSCPNKNGTTTSENITIPGATTPPVVVNNSVPSISVDKASATAGSTVTFSWNANGGTQCYTSVNGNKTGDVSGGYGTIPVTNAPAGVYSATLSCSFNGSIRTSSPVRVTVTNPAVVVNNNVPSISVDKSSATAGSTVTFYWNANGGTQCYTSVNGNVSGYVSGSSGTIPVANAPAGTYSATLSCSFDGSIRTSTPVRVVVN